MNIAQICRYRVLPTLAVLSAVALAGGRAAAADAPVTVTDNGATWTMDNGIVRATINKNNGNMTALVYRGVNTMGGGGYWEQTPQDAPEKIQKLMIDPATNGGARAEVSVKGITGGKVNLGNAGIGSASHLCGLLFQSELKAEMTTVPYKGTAPAIADLMAGMVRIAWELQLAGEKDVWARIENSPLADLGRAFAREAFLDFRTVNNGIANCAVFEAWFLSDRCQHEDRRLIQQMLADYQGYVFDAEQSSKAVTAELIVALGSMPFGKNYLAPYINTIVSDALFTEVRDRSNANFLWFIKFERSFQEKELQMIEESVKLSAEIVDFAKWSLKRTGAPVE